MRLMKSKSLPAESTVRFVVADDRSLLGGIGRVRDMMEAKFVTIDGKPKYPEDLDKWLAVKTGVKYGKVFDSREEALAAFKED